MSRTTLPSDEALLTRCNFPDVGSPVTCAVSGGADSLALLLLASAAGCDVTAVHVDHGLRDGSHREAMLVRDVAERIGAEFRSLTVKVGSGANVEARARMARYQALPAGVLTGHTADDQTETVLINLLRGAGLEGMAGMQTANRPLLGLRRSETRALCQAHGLQPFQDPSNSDPAFLRNRIRHEVMPLLNEVAQRDVVPVINRQVGQFRADADYLRSVSETVDATDAKVLAATDPVLARRAVRNWLRLHLDSENHPPGAATVERVLRVAANEAKACDVGGGWRVRRSQNRLHLEHGGGSD